jgi:hypothetical protein
LSGCRPGRGQMYGELDDHTPPAPGRSLRDEPPGHAAGLMAWGLRPHARGSPEDILGPHDAHAPESPRAREHPYRRQAQPHRAMSPQTPRQQTAPPRGCSRLPQSPRNGVNVLGLACSTLGQNACPGEALDIDAAETWTRVACREHGRGAGGAAIAEDILGLRPCIRRP